MLHDVQQSAGEAAEVLGSAHASWKSWAALLIGGVLVVVGAFVIFNAASLAQSSRSAQEKYLGPWAPQRDRLDEPGLLGAATVKRRTWSMRGAGVVGLAVGVGFILLGLR